MQCVTQGLAAECIGQASLIVYLPQCRQDRVLQALVDNRTGADGSHKDVAGSPKHLEPKAVLPVHGLHTPMLLVLRAILGAVLCRTLLDKACIIYAISRAGVIKSLIN